MGFTNSPLVDYTKISPNKTLNRKAAIDTITIHCVVGQCSVETLGNVFAPSSRQASSNYGVGYDGRIGMYVEEKDRSWCTSSSTNDNRAVTIEVASDTTDPYGVNDAAYEATIRLVADICKRNGIKKLLWKGDKNLIGKVDQQNMTAHRWFANKACPGNYLYNRFGDIADRVNKLLGANVEAVTPVATPVVAVNTSNTDVFIKGDIVKISGDRYYNSLNTTVPAWVKNKSWVVKSVSGDRVVLGESTDGKNNLNSAFKAVDLILVSRNNQVTTTSDAADPKLSFAVGDIVKFTGTRQYLSSTGASYATAVACTAKITSINSKGSHPYHLRAVDANSKFTSGIYGWVNKADIVSTSMTTPVSATTLAKKSDEEIAREVIKGKWGTGAVRKQLIEAAGYNYATVQSIVNKLLKG